VTNREGKLVSQAKGFDEDLVCVDSASAMGTLQVRAERKPDLIAAMKLGLKDYLAKTGFSTVHLGLSGGIDSAIVSVVAAQVLGADKVKCFLLPSQYSSDGSVSDSVELCKINGISYETIAIEHSYRALETALAPVFAGTEPGIAEENIQARIRGTLLMSYSNKFNSMLLTTGNKSELSVGYCTLYGDMSGGFGIIGDLFKTEVYELSEWLNRDGIVIPPAIITKAPSAELRPDQKDQDSLPPYEDLDAILEAFIERHKSADEIVAMGFGKELVRKVLRLVAIAEYKRWQAAPVLKLSPKSFGPGRRIPIARQFYELP
jgi:NAD+ synthase (glutamine-hydrolysing)